MAVAFGRVLRGAGLDVPVGSVTTFVEALGAVGVEREAGVYWAGRTTLVRRPEDVGTYDRAFAAFWMGRGAGEADERTVVALTLAIDEELPDDGADVTAPSGPTLTVRYSP